MLRYAVVFLVLALIAGLLGFTGIAGASIGIAKILFFVFIVLFVISFIANRRGRYQRAAMSAKPRWAGSTPLRTTQRLKRINHPGAMK